MSIIFRPRRGTVTTMTSTKKDIVLAKGEMFIEVPSNGVGTGPSRLIMGNGTDSYETLSNNHKYAIDGVSGYITSEVNADSTATTTSDILNDVTSGKTIRNLFGNIKKAINKNAIDIAKNASDIASTEAEISDIVNVYGAKNLLPYPYKETTKTVNGTMTLTDNGDGTVTVNGTHTSEVRFYFRTEAGTTRTDFLSKYAGKSVTLSFNAQSNYSSVYIEIALRETSSSSWIIYRCNNANGTVTFTVPSNIDNYEAAGNIYIIILANTTVSNQTFKPMLRLASIQDNTWQPYSKTNQELTGDVSTLTNRTLNNFYECSTPRSTAAKVVNASGFSLVTGAKIVVRFTDTGTSNPASGNLTLNVNGTGDITIVNAHSNKNALTYANAGNFYNNYIQQFVYDGTYWVFLDADSNTTRGDGITTKVAKTGTAQSNITTSIAANTTMDNAIGILLNNDATLNAAITALNNDITASY